MSIDENCLNNLAENKEYQKIKERLKDLLESELKKQNDPRIFGKGYVFDNYPPDRNAHFYERYMNGEKINAGWINESDFEK